jgi:stage V sporulation protein AB
MDNVILVFLGLSGGLAIAAGVFAFIINVGILPRIAGRTHTAWAAKKYENATLVGGIIGNLWTIFPLKMPIGYVGLGIFGVGAGIFVGCLAMAISEILNVTPIFSRRFKLKRGLILLILSIGLGKMAGSFYQLVYPVWKSLI